MGFMQKLRQNMPAVVIFLAVMFVALIVFEWGDAKRGRGSVVRGGGAIGEVNGEEISGAEFDSRVQPVIDMQRAQNPDAEIDEQQIRDAVWDQLVNEMLIRQEAERLGITISDAELAEAMMYDPPDFLKQSFTDSTGVFQQAVYQQFMGDIEGFLRQRQYPQEEIDKYKSQIVMVQEEIRRERLRQAVESAVTASAIPTISDLRTAYMEQRAKAGGSFALLPVSVIPDDQAKVSDQEAKKYYDENRALFTQKATREARYVMFPLDPSVQDSNVVRKKLTEVTTALGRLTTAKEKDSAFASFIDKYGAARYNGNSFIPLQEMAPELQNALQGSSTGDVIGPVRMADGTYMINVAEVKDSGEVYVKAQHILLRTEGANDDTVQAQAQKVLQRVRGGESFEAVASEVSADPGSASRGGDVGYFKRGMMVKPFEDAAFAATPGSIVGPIKSDFGYHIIKVNERTSKAYRLRDLKFDVRVGNLTRNQLRRRAADFRTQLAEGTSIDTLAARQKLQVFESGAIERNQPTAGSMSLTTFAFNGNLGDVSDVIELQDGSLVIAQISKVRNAGTMEFEDAKQGIVERLRTRKKLDLLANRANKLRSALKPGDSLTALRAVEPGIEVTPFNDVTRSSPVPGVGYDYALTAAIFDTQQGQLAGPIRGERGYYILRVDSRTQPTDQEFAVERPTFLKQLITQRRQQVFQGWLQKVREKAQIDDFRSGRPS